MHGYSQVLSEAISERRGNFMVKVLADSQYRAVILQDEMGLRKTGI
jgi:hypothetical protein